MSDYQIGAGIAAFAIASLGLWWFRLVLKDVRKMPKMTRTGIYALIWLAYFVAVVLVIGPEATEIPNSN